MNQGTLTYVKFGVVSLFVVGIFVVWSLGRIDAKEAMNDIGLGVAGLVAALGISAGGSALGSAIRAMPGPAFKPTPTGSNLLAPPAAPKQDTLITEKKDG